MTERGVLSPWELYVAGKRIQRLKFLLEQYQGYLSSTYIRDSVKYCLEHLSTLRSTKYFEFIGEKAELFLSNFNDKYWENQEKEELRDHVRRWEVKLEEFSKNWILSYPDTHIDISKLREGAKEFLSDDEFSMLEPLEEQNLKEAASSLLFANFTSAEFMALRTAESLLKKWYEKRTGKKLGRTTWGQVLEKLNKEFPNKRDRPKELLLLDYLSERRNEIAHPVAVSNSVQASTTFFNVISLCQTLYFKQD